MAPTSYAEVLTRNIRAARHRLGLEQADVVERMRALGYKTWHRQTIGKVERGERRITADEVLGLSCALTTSITRLMAPVDEDRVVEFQVDGEELSVTAVQMLARGLSDIGVSWYGNKPVMITPAVPVERFRQVFGDGSAVDQLTAVKREGERMAASDQQPVVAAIVTSDRGVLVGKRRDGKPPWTFIAGEQDVVKDDLPENTAEREVKEETGLLVRAGDVIGERVHPKTHRRMIYIAATPTHGTDVFVGDEDELAEVRWVSLAEAGELLPGMFEPVREYLARELSEAGEG